MLRSGVPTAAPLVTLYDRPALALGRAVAIAGIPFYPDSPLKADRESRQRFPSRPARRWSAPASSALVRSG